MSLYLRWLDGTGSQVGSDALPAVQVRLGGCDPASPSEDQAWRFEYDALGRMVGQIAPANAGTALDATVWRFDAGGLWSCTPSLGMGPQICRWGTPLPDLLPCDWTKAGMALGVDIITAWDIAKNIVAMPASGFVLSPAAALWLAGDALALTWSIQTWNEAYECSP